MTSDAPVVLNILCTGKSDDKMSIFFFNKIHYGRKSPAADITYALFNNNCSGRTSYSQGANLCIPFTPRRKCLSDRFYIFYNHYYIPRYVVTSNCSLFRCFYAKHTLGH